MTAVSRQPGTYRRQTVLGIGFASAILAAWASLHVYNVAVHRWTPAGTALAPLLIALQCWLNVGLFIVAHDCMHGSLAPFRPRVNLWTGRLCLTLYAGFSYDALIGHHFDHHRYPGTVRDPDFNQADPEHFWRWYASFLFRYFGLRPALFMAGISTLYILVLGADLANVLLLWALPAILSSLQLFYFGTYLPHRHDDAAFVDQHNSRSNDLNWLSSLLTCFHFGYHHEHHVSPQVPWWGLPRTRTGRARG